MSAGETRAAWVTVGTFATGLEADIARGRLEADGIPVLLQSDTAGIFGLAFQGNIAGGIALQDRKSTRLNSSHSTLSRMPSSA